MRINRKARRIYLAPALGLAIVAAATACSSSSSSSSSTPPATTPSTSAPAATSAAAPTTAASGDATAQIKANWATFFNSSTPNATRVKLLENGDKFSSAISSLSANPLASTLSSKVDSVSLTSDTKASVTYDLEAAGQAVASGQKGTAVLQDGTWKVGDDSFCGLLKEASSAIGVSVPAACSSVS